jgi:hypothetical protein
LENGEQVTVNAPNDAGGAQTPDPK